MDFGNGLQAITHGVNFTNSEIDTGSSTQNKLAVWPLSAGIVITSVSVTVSGGNALVAANTATTTNLSPRSVVLVHGVPLGLHGTNFNGIYPVASVSAGTNFTYYINATQNDSAASGGTYLTGNMPIKYWAAPSPNTSVTGGQNAYGIRNVTYSQDNATYAISTSWFGEEFSGITHLRVENIHGEGDPICIDIGAWGITSGIDIENADCSSGDGTNYVHTGVQINNQWATPTNITVHNLTCKGAPNTMGNAPNPTNCLSDLANGNTITYLHNPEVLRYELDGSGFPHAILANCTDMTKGWCDDGTTNSLYSGRSKIFSISDSSGAFTEYAGNALVNSGVPSEISASASTTTNTSISSTPILPAPVSSFYRVSFYVFQVAVGSSGACNTPTLVAPSIIFQDPNSTVTTTIGVGNFYTVTGPGTANAPMNLQVPGADSYTFRAKSGTNINYSTTVTAGNCTTAPTYYVIPLLQLL